MNYKKVLEKLGLKANVDFILTVDSFAMVEKTRMIPKVIHHQEVAATFDTNGVELTPLIPAYDEVEKIHHVGTPEVYGPDILVSPEIAAYDETVIVHHPEIPASVDNNGVEISPVVLAWDETTIVHHELVPAVYAKGELISKEILPWDETVLVAELYSETIPSNEVLLETWKHVQIEEADVSLLVNEYLADKKNLIDSENDHINIYNGQIHTWNFKNIPQPTIDELVALIAPMKTKMDKEVYVRNLKETGKKDREMCNNVLNLIDGFNRVRVLTHEQITQMQTTFSTIQMLLQAARPTSAKSLIQAIVPDEVLVTTEMKTLILEELVEA